MGFPSKNWSGLPFPSPGVFPTQELNMPVLHFRQIIYHWAAWEAPSGYLAYLKNLWVIALGVNELDWYLLGFKSRSISGDKWASVGMQGRIKAFWSQLCPLLSLEKVLFKRRTISPASVNMKGLVEEGNNGEIEKLDSCLNPPPSQIAHMVSCTVSWEMMEGGGPALACHFPPLTPLPGFSSGFLLILLVRWTPVSSEGWSMGLVALVAMVASFLPFPLIH